MHYQNRSHRQGFWLFGKKLFNSPFFHRSNRQVWQRAIAWLFMGLFMGLCLFALAACEPIPEPNQSSVGSADRLKRVLSRGKLICGVSGELPGFSFVNKEGKYSGLDVDICRAIAAALFNNPEAVQFRNLNAKERFTALQSGEIDILSRNTTWTLSRDTASRLAFMPIVFYDGQGVMVRKDSNIKAITDLKDADICAQTGTTTEQNLADQMRKRNLAYKPVVYEDVNATFNAYQSGRCTAITADRSALVVRRTSLADPDNHVVLDFVISKEPLAPAVIDGDPKWSDIVKWIIFAAIEAEDLDISSANLTTQLQSKNAEIRRFLGLDGSLGKDMGVANDFTVRVVKHVGNYAEIYDRNLGKDSPFKLPRGQNELWKNGGLMYAPPFR
ncbi:amino acid ABC transporter substrate-binding protein [Pseudanabaena sp. UWO310]|uniref:amino acid ABC transporter substrate-binding protein n=1 Tax=Pseudanabaena sp. UWO310 TaxID=2480795 RepID=UPI001157EF02|nr:amino acid ABC transporter substrate-binding protein [Pseudanabaena sp. UWO310]TYQ30643.1 amino acid ABC transporter substrate-binding protein [Pseudanabaena sp. UWO310]